MDQKKQLKQMIEFCQTTFNNAFNANAMLQDQFERVAATVLDQATWLPPEGRQAVEDWTDAYKKGCREFKQLMDENYQRVEAFFGG